MVDLVYRGLLSVKTAADEWLMPDDHNSPAPLTGYVVSFAPFHECGLMSPLTNSSAGFLITTRLSYII
jgi:hypothetical protein